MLRTLIALYLSLASFGCGGEDCLPLPPEAFVLLELTVVGGDGSVIDECGTLRESGAEQEVCPQSDGAFHLYVLAGTLHFAGYAPLTFSFDAPESPNKDDCVPPTPVVESIEATPIS